MAVFYKLCLWLVVVVCPGVLSVCLSVCLSCMSVCLCVHTFSLSVSLSVCVFKCSKCVSVCLCVCLPLCLSRCSQYLWKNVVTRKLLSSSLAIVAENRPRPALTSWLRQVC